MGNFLVFFPLSYFLSSDLQILAWSQKYIVAWTEKALKTFWPEDQMETVEGNPVFLFLWPLPTTSPSHEEALLRQWQQSTSSVPHLHLWPLPRSNQKEALENHKTWNHVKEKKWREGHHKFVCEIPSSPLSGTYMKRQHRIGFED